MSVEEVERLFLYTLNASCSSNQITRSESMKVLEELKENVENAGPLFQLLLKCHLERPDVSMAVIQVLEGFLTDKNAPTESSPIGIQLRAAFLSEFLEKQILVDRNAQIPSYLRNKICQFIVTAFVTETAHGSWPGAVSSLISLTESSRAGRELFLRWCLMLTEEIASQRPQLRTDSVHQRNTKVRDIMRTGDNAKLALFWKQILQSPNAEPIIVCLALECFAHYASWIDVSLVVETETLKLIYTHLQSADGSIQLAASDCLAEVVNKGMQVADKISLASYMNLESVFVAVGERGVVDAFFARVCKILSNLGFSLIVALQHQPMARSQVIDWCCSSLLPHLLRFTNVLAETVRKNVSAAHESSLWLESLSNLLPLLSSVFELARSCKDDLRQEFSAFALHFLPVLLQLAERSNEELIDASQSDSVDDEDEFMATIRPAILLHFDSITSIQEHATIAHLNIRRTEVGYSLGRIELLLQLILRLPEALRTAPEYVTSTNGSVAALTPIGELVRWACQIGTVLDTANKPLPASISLLAAEVIVRYSSTSFLDALPEEIDVCLRALVNALEITRYGSRASDFILRFIKNMKSRLSTYSSALLGLMQGHLASGLVRSTALFEAAGLAVAALDPATVSLSSAVSSLLQTTLQKALVLAPGEDPTKAAEAFDLLGAFARGFTTDSCIDPAPVRDWFTNVLGLLKGNNELLCHASYQIAAIGLIQRTIPLCQAECIPIIQEISVRILATNPPDCASLVLLLPLHSAAIFKLREKFTCPPFLGALWPQIINSCSQALDVEACGTDDIVNQANLCKVFLALLQAVSGSPAAASCTIALRQSPLEALLLSVARFIFRSCAAIDAIGLLRSLCGGIQKNLSILAPDFIYSTMLPFIFGRLIPLIFSQLDASVKVHVQALPASVGQLAHDALSMARAAQQYEPQPGLVAATVPISMVDVDLKDLKLSLLQFYIQ